MIESFHLISVQLSSNPKGAGHIDSIYILVFADVYKSSEERHLLGRLEPQLATESEQCANFLQPYIFVCRRDAILDQLTGLGIDNERPKGEIVDFNPVNAPPGSAQIFKH